MPSSLPFRRQRPSTSRASFCLLAPCSAPLPARLATIGLAVVLLSVALPASAQQQVPIGPFDEIFVDLSGNAQDDDDTAVRVKNLSGQPGTVVIEFDPDAGLGQQDVVEPGFVLIDGTLIVDSDLPAGQLRARYRVEAQGRALGRAGVRAGRARLMRRDLRMGRWRPAVRAIRSGRADVRYFRDARADFVLGHHGFSVQDQYVWAVVDVNSRYAAGGATFAPVPALAPRALFALGSVLILAATALFLRSRVRA